MRLLRHVYNRFKLTHDDQIAYFWLRKADYSRTGAGREDSEGLIDHVRAIESVVVAVVFEEMEPELTRTSKAPGVEPKMTPAETRPEASAVPWTPVRVTLPGGSAVQAAATIHTTMTEAWLGKARSAASPACAWAGSCGRDAASRRARGRHW